ncbi:hypothetical protein TcWFU_009462 [Taenia crassiceps]|uniref:Uncharacterized protein n=1 Tax=Taenia crassiceps TaxID=6207 RepID=A0ABR4Q2I7_9CEST
MRESKTRLTLCQLVQPPQLIPTVWFTSVSQRSAPLSRKTRNIYIISGVFTDTKSWFCILNRSIRLRSSSMLQRCSPLRRNQRSETL